MQHQLITGTQQCKNKQVSDAAVAILLEQNAGVLGHNS